MILRSMIKDSMSPLHEDFYESIFHRDAEVNRLVFLVKRVIKSALAGNNSAKKMGKGNLELLKDWNVVSLLESVGDEIKRIARHFKQIDEKSLKELTAINIELGEKYLELMKSYHTKNPLIAYSVELSHKKRIEALESIEEKTKDHATTKLIGHMKILEAHLKNVARTVMMV
jgi:phosphate uptake regulator